MRGWVTVVQEYRWLIKSLNYGASDFWISTSLYFVLILLQFSDYCCSVFSRWSKANNRVRRVSPCNCWWCKSCPQSEHWACSPCSETSKAAFLWIETRCVMLLTRTIQVSLFMSYHARFDTCPWSRILDTLPWVYSVLSGQWAMSRGSKCSRFLFFSFSLIVRWVHSLMYSDQTQWRPFCCAFLPFACLTLHMNSLSARCCRSWDPE